MKALATRLKNLALRPLWTETAVHKARRRIHVEAIDILRRALGVARGIFSPEHVMHSRTLGSVRAPDLSVSESKGARF